MKSIYKIEDIPDSAKDLALSIGLEPFFELVKLVGGQAVYVPSEKTILKNKRNRLIKEDFNYTDPHEICKRYNITLSHARRIINEN